MDISELYLDYAQALASSAAISSWCVAEYGQAHKVYMNFDRRNPPGENDCPYVAIYPVSKRVGQLVGAKGHGFEVVCCLFDDTSRVHAHSNITEYEGVRQLEVFRKKAEDVITEMAIDNAVIEALDIEYETIETFPFLMCGMIFQVREELLIGQNVFT